MKNRGKEWEKHFKEALIEYIGNGYSEDRHEEYDIYNINIHDKQYKIDFERLYDTMYGKGIVQPSDFFIYSYPNIIYVECKSVSDNLAYPQNWAQITRLIKKARTKNVICGFVLWFVLSKVVYWLDIDFIISHIQSTKFGAQKGLTPKLLDEYIRNSVQGIFKFEQKTSRVYPKLNLDSWFRYLREENED